MIDFLTDWGVYAVVLLFYGAWRRRVGWLHGRADGWLERDEIAGWVDACRCELIAAQRAYIAALKGEVNPADVAERLEERATQPTGATT